MHKIDLVATLVVRFGLIIGGASLLYTNGRGLAGDIMMYQVLGMSRPDMIIQFFGLHIGLILVGLALIGFSAVNIIRALRVARQASEAPPATGPADPLSFKRIVSAVAFGLGTLFGLVTLAPAIVPMIEVTNYALNGTVIEASIDHFETGPDESAGRIVHYYFKVGGAVYTGVQPVDLNTWSRTDRTKRIDIVYLSADPAQNDLATPSGLQQVGFFLVTRVGLILLGIWGVWKNLRPTFSGLGPVEPRAPIVPRIPSVSAPAPMAPRPMPSRAGAPRGTFGKRGA